MFTIGADPEIFIRNKYTNTYKSAVGMIGGSKEKPLPIDEVGHAVQEDNVAVEFNVPPAGNLFDFRASIHKVLAYLRDKLPDYELDQASAVSFPEAELQTREAQMFGCEPDFDAWRMMENQKPKAADPNLRSCGGHIHVGNELAINDPISVIRAMDLFLGVPSVVIDKGTLRRELYGKAGSFRFKPYGCEYRTLSNFWIFDDLLIKWAFEGTQRALEFVEAKQKISKKDGNLIQLCINNGDMKAYEYLAKSYELS